ncbi:unnamed protein product [Durusdinium trenchii]|uniref:Uncharacterized protein n=2 Tax=Durusdinium trenchii TaxID=1381693 RepID=A0ABP0KC09_9DINO
MVRVFNLSGEEVMNRTEVLSVEELSREVAAAMGAHCRLMLHDGSPLTDGAVSVEEVTAVVSSTSVWLETWLKFFGLVQEDGTPFSETFSREDLEMMALKLGHAALQRSLNSFGYQQFVTWPFDCPAPETFEKGSMALPFTAEILPAGTCLRFSCAPGPRGPEGIRTLSKAMTVLDVMRLTLNNGIKSSDPEAARLLASPEAKKVGATDLNRKGKVMELEPPDIHFLFFWEFGSLDDWFW